MFDRDNHKHAELVRRCIGGDAAALRELQNVLEPTVRGVIAKVLPADLGGYAMDDLVNEAFFRVFRVLRKWRGGNIHAYAAAIARFRAMSLVRRELKLTQAVGSVESTQIVAKGPDPQAAVTAKEDIDFLREAIESLCSRHRQVVEMRLGGLSFVEMGRTLGIPKSTARMRYKAALLELRHMLKSIE